MVTPVGTIFLYNGVEYRVVEEVLPKHCTGCAFTFSPQDVGCTLGNKSLRHPKSESFNCGVGEVALGTLNGGVIAIPNEPGAVHKHFLRRAKARVVGRDLEDDDGC